ncbi:MAG: LacI family DNA-binding transcriptional regulator [Balneolaceae bacterium]
MPKTIYDIAKAAGVSIATVSRVFNSMGSVKESTRKKVLAIADDLGYHPQAFAQGLARKKKGSIMMLVPVMSNYFFTEILRGIQDYLSPHNVELNIVNINQGMDTYTQTEHILKRHWADGYLLVSLHLNDKQHKLINKYQVPISLIDDSFDDFDSVSFDNVNGGYTATRYFLDKGYRKIVVLSASPTAKPIQGRLKGYKKALEEYGIQFDENLVITGNSIKRDGFTEQSGYQAMKKILQLDPLPEACFCMSDIKAVGAMKAMREVSMTLPVISYDNLSISDYIGLSTVSQPMYEMGYKATKNLIHRISNKKAPVSHKIYNPRLIIRSSSEIPLPKI